MLTADRLASSPNSAWASGQASGHASTWPLTVLTNNELVCCQHFSHSFLGVYASILNHSQYSLKWRVKRSWTWSRLGWPTNNLEHPVEETTAHCTISWPYHRGRPLDTVYRACHVVVSYYCLILLVISAKSPAI